jgi:hypothetical protein
MNSIHNNGPDDKSLNDELEELGHAYQQLSSEEPPELLDQGILNSAHRAVKKRDHWLDFGWVHGLTTAAVVVLAMSIILTQRQPTGLEENGLSPADAAGETRSRVLESALRDEVRQERSNEAEQKKQELSKELRRESRKDAGQVMPASSAPETQAGSRAEAIPARDTPDDFRVKKSMQPGGVPLEEDILQANEPAEVRVAKPSTLGFADEPAPAEAAEVEIDAIKSDADKIDAERSQLTTEPAQLQAILKLKNAGDIRWKTELKIFIENYPDYPLPDELKN